MQKHESNVETIMKQ